MHWHIGDSDRTCGLYCNARANALRFHIMLLICCLKIIRSPGREPGSPALGTSASRIRDKIARSAANGVFVPPAPKIGRKSTMPPIDNRPQTQLPLSAHRPTDLYVISGSLKHLLTTFLRLVLTQPSDVQGRQRHLEDYECPRAIVRTPGDPERVAGKEPPKAGFSSAFALGCHQPRGGDACHHRGPLECVDPFHRETRLRKQ